jgi:hypothetical protein
MNFLFVFFLWGVKNFIFILNYFLFNNTYINSEYFGEKNSSVIL